MRCFYSRSVARALVITAIVIGGNFVTGDTTTVIQPSVFVRYPTGSPPMMHPYASIIMEGPFSCSDVAVFLTSPLGRDAVATACREELYLEITPTHPLLERRRYELEYRRGNAVTEQEFFTTEKSSLPSVPKPQLVRMDYSPAKPENRCVEEVRFIIEPSGVERYPFLLMLQRSPEMVDDWATLTASLVPPEASHIDRYFSFTQCKPPLPFPAFPSQARSFPKGRSKVRILVRDVFSREYATDSLVVDIPPVGVNVENKEARIRLPNTSFQRTQVRALRGLGPLNSDR